MIPDQKIALSDVVRDIFAKSAIQGITGLESMIEKILREKKSEGELSEVTIDFITRLFAFMKESRKTIFPKKEYGVLAMKTPKEILQAFHRTVYVRGVRMPAISKADRISIMQAYLDPLYLGLIILAILED